MLQVVLVLTLVLLSSGLRLESELPNPDPVPIYGGERTAEGEFPSVVSFQAGGAFCTGTVVAPRVVLTAAHCVSELPSAADLTVFFGSEAFLASQSVKAVEWGAHPDFCSSSSCGQEIHDLGYLVLETDFVVPDYPAPIVTQGEWDETMQPGRPVTLVGFGEANNDPGASMRGLGIKRKVDVTLERLTPAGLEFFAGGEGKDTCVGDSGGPAFITLEDGSVRLAGILSRGSDPCGEGGFYGIPYAGLCWVRDETGVNLLTDGCEDCGCLDTTPPPNGCGCGQPYRDAPRAWLGLLALGVRRRRL